MLKRLVKTGNSMAVVLDKELMQRVNITADTQLEVSVSGDAIVLTPVRDPERVARFRSAAERVNLKYAGAFARLAK